MRNRCCRADPQKELEELKSKFISNISHELRSLLVTIQKSLAIAQDPAAGPLSETQKKFLEIAERNLKNLTVLIDDMLDTAKTQQKRRHQPHETAEDSPDR